MKPTSILLILAATLLPIRAEVKCLPGYGSHMVLQRDQPVPMWGTAAAGEKVTVQFGGAKTQPTARLAGNYDAKRVSLERVVTGCRSSDDGDGSWVMVLEAGRLQAKKFRQILRMGGVISI